MGRLSGFAGVNLDEAIDHTREALKLKPEESPERANMMIHLGDRFLNDMFTREIPTDHEKAGRYYSTALKHQGAPIRVRLAAAG